MKKIFLVMICILMLFSVTEAVTLTIQQPQGNVTMTRPVGSYISFNDLTNQIKWWKVLSGGVEVIDGGFTMPNNDVVVEAMYTGHVITVMQSTGGTISPGTVGVDENGSKRFTITPNSGYRLTDVKVDGISVGAKTSHTFSNVTSNHTITASFEVMEANSYTIIASAGTGGTISPSGSTAVTLGDSKTFTIEPNENYAISDVKVDGSSISLSLLGTGTGSSKTYTFSNITSNHTISVEFQSNRLSREITMNSTMEIKTNVSSGTLTFTYTGDDATATVSNSRPSVATTTYTDGNNAGTIKITPVAEGTTIITVTISGIDSNYYTATATCEVTVVNPSYEITFNANGGTFDGSSTNKSSMVKYGNTYGSGTNGFPVPTRSGYTFVGYFTANSGGSRIESTTVHNAYSKKTFYAQWVDSDIVKTTRYYANGGTFEDGTTVNEIVFASEGGEEQTYYSHTSNITNPSGPPTSFSGTYYDDEDIDDTITIPGAESLSVTVYYQTYGYDDVVKVYEGEDIRSSALKAELCGSSSSGNFLTETLTIEGDTVRIVFDPDYMDIYGFGYCAIVTGTPALIITPISGEYKEPTSIRPLKGWNTSSTSTSSAYNASTSMYTGLDLYAVWTGKVTTFDANGGTFDDGKTINEVAYSSTNRTYISCTSNVVKKDEPLSYSGTYSNGEYVEDTFTVEGATSLEVFVQYSTESADHIRIYRGDEQSAINLVRDLSGGGGTYSDADDQILTETITVNGDTVTIVFETDSLDEYGFGYKATVRGTSNTIHGGTYKEPTLAGIPFIGWSTSAVSKVATYEAGDESVQYTGLTLYAVWGGYVTTYNANGGTFADGSVENVIGYTSTGTVSNITAGEYKNPTKATGELLGWSTNPNATSPEYQLGAGYLPNADITLYAVWEYRYVVTYDANGGTFSGGSTTNVVKYKGGNMLSEVSHTSNVPETGPTNSVLQNSTYSNSNIEDEITIPGATELTVEITYQTESWDTITISDRDKFEVVLAGNSDLYDRGTIFTETYTVKGDTVYISFEPDSLDEYGFGYYAKVTSDVMEKTITSGSYKEPTLSTRTLLGWSTDRYASTVEYPLGSTYLPNKTVTLYAVWQGYTVTYNANGGTISETGGTTTTRTVAYNGSYGSVGMPSAERYGYKQTGWYTQSSGGTKVTETSTLVTKANHTLYAQWEREAVKVEMDDYTYGERLSTPSLYAYLGSGTPVFYYNTTNSTTGGINWSTVDRSTDLDAGTYYMYATVDGTTIAPTEFKVEKAEGYLSIQAEMSSIYNEYSYSAYIDITDSHGGEITVTTNRAYLVAEVYEDYIRIDNFNMLSVGTVVTITVTCEETTNYTAATDTCTITCVSDTSSGGGSGSSWCGTELSDGTRRFTYTKNHDDGNYCTKCFGTNKRITETICTICNQVIWYYHSCLNSSCDAESYYVRGVAANANPDTVNHSCNSSMCSYHGTTGTSSWLAH